MEASSGSVDGLKIDYVPVGAVSIVLMRPPTNGYPNIISSPDFPKSPSPLISSSQPARCFSVIPSMVPVRLALIGPIPEKPRMLRSRLLRLWAKKN
jgi:hypothetical protein